MNNQFKETEVLVFERDDRIATIATNGERTVSQEFEYCREHKSLQAAISYLEAEGYHILPDMCQDADAWRGDS